jgi:hypothetical protein
LIRDQYDGRGFAGDAGDAGDVFRRWTPGFPLRFPDHIQTRKHHQHHQQSYKFVNIFNGSGLLVITGNHHQQVSSITSSALIDAPGKITSITSKTLEP